MTTVLPLDHIDASMIATVGGKAANLGTLRQAGLPVPDGFCVTTDAYRSVAGRLMDELYARLGGGGETADAAALAARARHLIETAPVPAELERAVLDAYQKLGGVPVAVRSSATAEDLDFASFAGQQDSYLNVVGEAALMTAVRRCWASLWTDRAVSYRNTQGIPHDTVALAVVVQEMVQAASAGVMFTANPVTGTRQQTVIDASPGLGESVVSGAVNPDHFVVDTSTATIVDRRLGDKRVLVRSLAGGGTERVDLADSSEAAALSDEQVLDLARLGGRVQQLYGAPQDTEWAIDDAGTLWLTQSRPITTLYPLAGSDPAGVRVYMCMTLAQGLTRPITPMGLAGFRLIASAVATATGSPPEDALRGPRSFVEAGQRAFVDFTDVLRNPVGRRAVLTAFGYMEARAAAVLKGMTSQPEFDLVPGSAGSAVAAIGRVARKVGAPRRLVTAVLDPQRAYLDIAGLESQLRVDLELPDDTKPAERLRQVQRMLGEVFWFMPKVVTYAVAGFLLLGLAQRLLADALQPGELQTVLRGLPHNVTTEMDLDLWRLSSEIAADPASRAAFVGTTASELTDRFRKQELPSVAQQGLAEFLRHYGHRAVAEIDLGMPRWSDDPTHLVGVLSNYLRLDDPALAPSTQFRAGNAAAEAMVQTLVDRAGQRSRWRAGVVAFSLRRARQLTGLREAPKNLLVLALAGIRHQLWLVGQWLAAQGTLASADDVFFLDLAEVQQAVAGGGTSEPPVDLAAVVSRRKEAYAAELRRRHIPRILLSDGTEPETLAVVATPEEGTLVGSPASAGTVTAPARVILDPVGAHLEPGEILVAPSTDPGWTPLFLTAGGLVMEMGGSNSHGAVVAREYGIPAVVGVPDATSKISTGQSVTVDGAAGLVRPAQR